MVIPAGSPKLRLEVGSLKARAWRLQVFIDDDTLKTQIIGQEDTIRREDIPPNAASAVPNWTTLELDLSKYAGKTVRLRLYHWLVAASAPGAAYWRPVRIE